MNITISKNIINNEEVNSVNARELHSALESKQEFSNWVKRRISKYGFEKDFDFLITMSKSTGGRPTQDYIVTIDMAKELAMVENNNKGKQARKYFISCEKQLKEFKSSLAEQINSHCKLAKEHKEAAKAWSDFGNKVLKQSKLSLKKESKRLAKEVQHDLPFLNID